jgi:hypothetical protein
VNPIYVHRKINHECVESDKIGRNIYVNYPGMSKNRCFLPNCCSFCQAVSEEKIFRNRQLEKKLPVVAMFVSGSGRNEQSLSRTYHIYLLASFSSFGHAVSEEKIFKKSAN